MAPAAASLLLPGRYASAVLAGSGRLPALTVPFDYGSPAELAGSGRLPALTVPFDYGSPAELASVGLSVLIAAALSLA